MSLDIYLAITGTDTAMGSGIFVREDGQIKEISRAEWDDKFPGREPITANIQDEDDGVVYTANITHNLGRMADEAGIYKYLWRPEEIGVTKANQLIEPLSTGLELLKSDPAQFRKFNPSNGWGTYEILIEFVQQYLNACKKYQIANVTAHR